MNAWVVQGARITVFPLLASGPAPRSALDLFRSVRGKDPDSFQSQAPVGSPFPNSVAQGIVRKLNLVCQAQPIRTDFTFGPVLSATNPSFASIDDTAFLKSEMTALIGKIEDAFQETPLNRVAVFLQLGQEASNYREANQVLLDSVWQQQKMSLTDEQDFVLQINRARSDTTDPSVKLNFVTKWSVERLQIVMFFNTQMSPVGGPSTANAPIVTEKIVPTVTFDNSNMPLQKAFDRDEAPRLLSELFSGVTAQLNECNISIRGF